MPAPAIGGTHVADPRGLAGEGHKILAAIMGDPD